MAQYFEGQINKNAHLQTVFLAICPLGYIKWVSPNQSYFHFVI